MRGCEVISDRFTAQTPDGPVPMENIIAKFPGKSGRAIAISGHYDTKKMANFVGANDGGSSTGVLLELAAALQGRPRVDDVYLVFFDGEEAFHEWTDTDSLYGSRHLAEKWTADGTNRASEGPDQCRYDRRQESASRLGYEFRRLAAQTGLGRCGFARLFRARFRDKARAIEDDHMPFINAGVRAVDLIDFDSQNTFWHTPQDTLDKLDPHSFEVIGAVVMKSIEELEQQK